MKKSQAIKKLNEFLAEWENSKLTDGKCAKALLKFLETEIGMMPPAITGLTKAEETEDGQLYIKLWGWEK